jgi:hypothetical protein
MHCFYSIFDIRYLNHATLCSDHRADVEDEVEVASAWLFVFSWLLVMALSCQMTWSPCGSSMVFDVASELSHRGIGLPGHQDFNIVHTLRSFDI